MKNTIVPEDTYTTHAWNAFDTNKSTQYKSLQQDGWIGLGLKTLCQMKKVRICARADRIYHNPGF